ncbi:hypothetical protein CL656_03180 [bacterium]|nr:hypothetical protein [bacterium]
MNKINTNQNININEFNDLCGPENSEGKITPTVEMISSLIQYELSRVFNDLKLVDPQNLKHITLDSYKDFLNSYLHANSLTMSDLFSNEVIKVFIDQILDKTNLHEYLLPNYTFLIFPIPFDTSLRPVNELSLKSADNLKILLLENMDSKVSFTTYRGTYLHKILPSEFLDCSFKIPQFTQGQPLTNEFKEELKSEIINSIDKLKDLLI